MLLLLMTRDGGHRGPVSVFISSATELLALVCTHAISELQHALLHNVLGCQDETVDTTTLHLQRSGVVKRGGDENCTLNFALRKCFFQKYKIWG